MGEGGSTVGDHLWQYRKSKGLLSEEELEDHSGDDGAVCPRGVPQELLGLWTLYLRISTTRQATGFGISPLQYGEMLAWSRLYGRPLAIWEVELVLALDGVYRKVCREHQDAAARFSRTHHRR